MGLLKKLSMQTLESDYFLNQIKKYFVHRAVTYIF